MHPAPHSTPTAPTHVPTMSWTPLTIILQSSTQKDQTLRVTPNWDMSEYKVVFVNRVLDSAQTFHLRQKDVAYYLRTFLESVYYDDDEMTPTEHVQFDVPGYPTVIVKVCNLRMYIENLLDQMEILQKEWPVEKLLPRTTDPSRYSSRSSSNGRVGMSEDW